MRRAIRQAGSCCSCATGGWTTLTSTRSGMSRCSCLTLIDGASFVSPDERRSPGVQGQDGSVRRPHPLSSAGSQILVAILRSWKNKGAKHRDLTSSPTLPTPTGR